METCLIKATNIPDAWFQAVVNVQDPKYSHIWTIDEGSYKKQKRMEFFNFVCEITFPCDGPLNSRIVQPPECALDIMPPIVDPIIYPEINCPVCGEKILNFTVDCTYNDEVEKIYAAPCNCQLTYGFYKQNYPTYEANINKYFSEYLFSSNISENETYTYGSRLLELIHIPKFNVDGSKFHLHDLIINDEYLEPMIDHYSLINDEYGFRIPQYYAAVAYLKNSPNTNQVVLQIANQYDLGLCDPPCLRHIDCRVIDNKLYFFIYFRSWDLWGGFPANLAAISLLMEMMCADTGLNPGSFICESKGLHLYDHGWDLAKIRTGKA